jgi:hypothetical protein
MEESGATALQGRGIECEAVLPPIKLRCGNRDSYATQGDGR